MSLQLPAGYGAGHALAWRGGEAVTHAQFSAHARALALRLPASGAVLNLCEDRYLFSVALTAAALCGHLSLLPASRAPAVLAALVREHPGCSALCDEPVAALDCPQIEVHVSSSGTDGVLEFEETQIAAVAYTSGSSGAACAHPKQWSELAGAAQLSSRALALRAGGQLPRNIVATVPPQHMYGLEFSVMLPLAAGCAAHAGRPFFVEDFRRALAQVPAPRMLLTTPLHLRKLLESGGVLPPLALIVSATAPLPPEDARAAEQRYGAPVCEVYGCTEAGSIATRRAALDEPWLLHAGMSIEAGEQGCVISGPQLPVPVALADHIELLGDGRFCLLGRSADMLKVAGKRASLAELTRLLLGIPGVRDAAVFVPDLNASEQRPAALVEAPELDEREILSALSAQIDPVFVPRPLRKVSALPRDGMGKLPHAALVELLRHG